MKIFFLSAGIAAIGAMSLHADEYAPDVTAMDASKMWTVSGTLRGFYDDNYNTAPNGQKQGSAGFEASPSFNLLVPLQQTELGLRYTYGLYYYQQRENQGANPIDQTHQVDLWIDHAFTERLEGKVEDTFVSQQDPTLSSTASPLPYRANGNNIQNIATASLHTEWTMLFSDDLGYQNTYLQYHQHGATIADIVNTGGSGPTYAGLLNQDGNSVYLNLNYQYLPDLSFLVGYQFGLVAYTGGEPIAQYFLIGKPVYYAGGGHYTFTQNNSPVLYYSASRDQYSHTAYIGGKYTALANLSLSVQAGVQYSHNYNLPSFDNQTADSYQPYANVALTYTYMEGDYAQVGFSQSESSSATADPNALDGALTLYSESSVIYASINHQITPNLLATVIGHYQYSTFVSGQNDGLPQNWYSLGLNLSYTFNPHLSAEIGYNLDYLTKAGPLAGYSRNQGYLGVTATY